MKAHLHSCGLVDKFVPEFIDVGIDALNPLEVKAGMNPTALKAAYGDRARIPRRHQCRIVGSSGSN